MQLTNSVAIRFLLALGIIILLVAIGSLVGGSLGSSLRERIQLRSSLIIDSVIGAVFQALAMLIATWLVAIPLVAGLPGSAANGIRNSFILGRVDAVAPSMLANLPSRVSAMLSDTGLPPLISPFSTSKNVAVDAPAIAVEDVALVERVRPSVIHVVGGVTSVWSPAHGVRLRCG